MFHDASDCLILSRLIISVTVSVSTSTKNMYFYLSLIKTNEACIETAIIVSSFIEIFQSTGWTACVKLWGGWTACRSFDSTKRFHLLRYTISTALSVAEREVSQWKGLSQCHCRSLFKTREVCSPWTNTLTKCMLQSSRNRKMHRLQMTRKSLIGLWLN